MRRKAPVIVSTAFGIILGLFVASGLGRVQSSQAAPNFEYLDLFTKVLHFVQTNYVDEVESKKLIEGAIKGMLATLDPHTVYLPPESFKDMQVDTSGKFGGLGIEITITDGFLTVVTPIDDTPAFFAGVEPGDKIYIIEDKVKKVKKETKSVLAYPTSTASSESISFGAILKEEPKKGFFQMFKPRQGKQVSQGGEDSPPVRCRHPRRQATHYQKKKKKAGE